MRGKKQPATLLKSDFVKASGVSTERFCSWLMTRDLYV